MLLSDELQKCHTISQHIRWGKILDLYSRNFADHGIKLCSLNSTPTLQLIFLQISLYQHNSNLSSQLDSINSTILTQLQSSITTRLSSARPTQIHSTIATLCNSTISALLDATLPCLHPNVVPYLKLPLFVCSLADRSEFSWAVCWDYVKRKNFRLFHKWCLQHLQWRGRSIVFPGIEIPFNVLNVLYILMVLSHSQTISKFSLV